MRHGKISPSPKDWPIYQQSVSPVCEHVFVTATGLIAPDARRTITAEVDELLARAEALVKSVDAATFDVDLARRLVERSARLERVAGALGAMAARRVADSNAWTREGDRSPAHWVARQTGVSVGAASATIDLTARLDRLPEVDHAVRTGRLSAPQAKEVVAAAAADPKSETKLVELAGTASLGELKVECAKVKAAAEPNEEERRNKIHRTRRFRHWTDADGAFAFAGRTTADQRARLLASLEPYRKQIFDDARRHGRRESQDAYAMDARAALAQSRSPEAVAPRGNPSAAAPCDTATASHSVTSADQATGPPESAATVGPNARVHVRVDHSALVRGTVAGGETCEIAGVGPVPVATAKAMMNDAFLATIVTDGVDVQAVAHLGRTIPAHVRTALMERDPRCVVPGCTVTEHLEIDHLVPFAEGGPTALANLARLCSFHHDQKTYSGYRLVGAPGRFKWEAPARSNRPERPPP